MLLRRTTWSTSKTYICPPMFQTIANNLGRGDHDLTQIPGLMVMLIKTIALSNATLQQGLNQG